MIDINLLPINLKNKDAQGAGFLKFIDLPREVLMGVGGLCVSVLIVIHVLLIGGYVIQLARQVMDQRTWQSMLQDKKNIDSISQEMKEVRAKISTIYEITSKKFITWSSKLNILSDQMPKSIWFRRIVWDSKALVVEGSAFSKFHDEINIVGNFVANLKKDGVFMKNFSSIELNSATRSKRGVVEVVDFKMTVKAQ